MAQNNVI